MDPEDIQTQFDLEHDNGDREKFRLGRLGLGLYAIYPGEIDLPSYILAESAGQALGFYEELEGAMLGEVKVCHVQCRWFSGGYYCEGVFHAHGELQYNSDVDPGNARSGDVESEGDNEPDRR